MEHPCFVGIDVSKAYLDVYVRPSGESFRVSHDDAGFAALIARVAHGEHSNSAKPSS
jgi:transposase